jgi:hypothetical protein
MKKYVFFAGTPGIALAFVLAFSGCTSLGRPQLLGTVTMTGIPAEYEGGTVAIAWDNSETIANGSVSIMVQGADEDGFVNFSFTVSKAGVETLVLFFESVLFENQTAAVNWDDGEILQRM